MITVKWMRRHLPTTAIVDVAFRLAQSDKQEQAIKWLCLFYDGMTRTDMEAWVKYMNIMDHKLALNHMEDGSHANWSMDYISGEKLQ